MAWVPETEASIQLAIADGTLAESASFEAKELIGDTDGARKETARDLASFAIYGGAILVGVAEDKLNRTFTLAPFKLEHTIERLEQVATNRIDPPLHIRVNEIPSSDDPDIGYLWVEVPPSPLAPHMVDGTYYARGERTKRRLHDAEVVRLHAQRQAREDGAELALDDLIGRDPVPKSDTQSGRLFLVAEPLTPPRGMARDIVAHPNNSEMFELIRLANRVVPNAIHACAPTPGAASRFARRAAGAAFSSLEDGRRFGPDQRAEGLVDIELEEAGGARLTVGRLTPYWGNEPERVIFDALAVAYAFRTVGLAKAVSDRTGYRGSWAFAMGATALSGLASYRMFEEWGGGHYPRYDREEFRSTSVASAAELADDLPTVVERLIGSFLRGLGVERSYSDMFARPAIED